ncbi:unnamed protein product, partial [Cyprideis torosa]
MTEDNVHISPFYAISISYEKAHTEIRGKYTFFSHNIEDFAREIRENNLGFCFIISTCNRTEIYAQTPNLDAIINLFCEYVNGDKDEFMKYIDIYENTSAINHLFRVSAGLESQILGDFEIVGQLKIWFKKFKKHKLTNAYLEKLLNTSLSISKNIKHKTALSNGAASVSYAAVNYILQNIDKSQHYNIVLLGIGKIGQNTCENLVKHTENTNITLINRTPEKAEKLAQKFWVQHKEFSELKTTLAHTDILIVATSSDKPIINAESIDKDKTMIIIDLSVPSNVSPELKNYSNITLLNVDDLSKMIDETLEMRTLEIPKAEAIIDKYTEELSEWEETRKLAPAIVAFKEDLLRLNHHNFNDLRKNNPTLNGKETLLSEKLVQKITNRFADYIISNPDKKAVAIDIMKEIPLALWQAEKVAENLSTLGHQSQIVPIISEGDKNLKVPIYELGITGVFTKDLDIALLNEKIDLAVHSLKDIPTRLPENIFISAVLERDFPEDVLVRNPKAKNKNYNDMHIGTGSLRRQCFWKNAYPNATFGNIRGNVQTRLQKLESENFDGVIFSLAGIKRMEMNIDYEYLSFITPAPAQGVVACCSLQNNKEINSILAQINHSETAQATKVERDFLQTLEGGCSAPI